MAAVVLVDLARRKLTHSGGFSVITAVALVGVVKVVTVRRLAALLLVTALQAHQVAHTAQQVATQLMAVILHTVMAVRLALLVLQVHQVLQVQMATLSTALQTSHS